MLMQHKPRTETRRRLTIGTVTLLAVVATCLISTHARAEDGSEPGADDPFDAVVGLFGLLNVVRGARASGEPDDPVVRRIEGWILGLDAAETRRKP